MTIDAIEAHLGVQFPERHRQAFLDAADPIHDACDFLVPSTPYPGLDIVQVNNRLHATPPDAWPAFLVAFASNGCGDYFAYDLRTSPTRIIYIDPDNTVDENLASDDKLQYDSFACWHTVKTNRIRRRMNFMWWSLSGAISLRLNWRGDFAARTVHQFIVTRRRAKRIGLSDRESVTVTLSHVASSTSVVSVAAGFAAQLASVSENSTT